MFGILSAVALVALLSARAFSAVSTYTFETGGGTDKWLYEAASENSPANSGPDITGQVASSSYTEIAASDGQYISSSTTAGIYLFLNS
ncbi:MAG: hypothetical protein COZ15_01370, partial [Elusimicrobia bacterium CG_4_10_14_3_um_filter_49_12_50_7]